MISDGIMPTNEGRGYVLRRLIRRAARHGRLLGISGSFLADLSATVIETSREGYPELEEKRVFIHEVLDKEEEAFGKTIDQGLKSSPSLRMSSHRKMKRHSPVRKHLSFTIRTDSRSTSRRIS